MAIALLSIAFQLHTASLPAPWAEPVSSPASDSVRSARHARDAQAGFERLRRANLPWEGGSGDRCEVRLGRYCWWYDESTPSLPPERDAIVRGRRARPSRRPALLWRPPAAPPFPCAAP